MEVDVGAQLFTTLLLMFGGALAAGAAPFFLRVREAHMQTLAALGAGLLIGTALAVIVPEGFHAFAQAAGHGHAHGEVEGHSHDHDHAHAHSVHGEDHGHAHGAEEEGLPEGMAGLVLVCGFLAMLLLDRLQHAAGGSCGHPGHSHGHTHSHTHGHGHSHSGGSSGGGMTCSPSQERLREREKGREKVKEKGSDDGSSGCGGDGGAAGGKHASGADDVAARGAPASAAAGAGAGAGAARGQKDASVSGDKAAQAKGPVSAAAPPPPTDPSSAITGLLIHCCADGLAMGAAFLSGNARLTMIIAAAMVLHKAPMAFGLSTYLMACRWNFQRSQRTLLLFSAAAPAATVATYALLGSLSFLSSPPAVALCLIFSGGTFLYAATMHILPEVLSSSGSERMSSAQLVAVVVGSLLPVALSWGHHH